jgi:hypothetical protein
MIRRAAFPFVLLSSIRAFAVLLPLTLFAQGNECLAQTLSLFTNATPAKLAVSSTSAITRGVKFWTTQSGTISAIRFYRAAKSPNGYVARLYSAAGALFGSVPMAQESSPVPGWQAAVFPRSDSSRGKHELCRGLLCP